MGWCGCFCVEELVGWEFLTFIGWLGIILVWDWEGNFWGCCCSLGVIFIFVGWDEGGCDARIVCCWVCCCVWCILVNICICWSNCGGIIRGLGYRICNIFMFFGLK